MGKRKQKQLPTTGKYCHKPYQCTECGREEELGTNHWGQCYPICRACLKTTVWKCLEKPPKGMGLPTPWKMVKLGDVVTISSK